jgi:hypothetical protein
MSNGLTKIERIAELEQVIGQIATSAALSLDECRALCRCVQRTGDDVNKWKLPEARIESLKPRCTKPLHPKMTSKANGATYEAYRAAGWTDAMMREHGYIL